jgi:hypothetical protein
VEKWNRNASRRIVIKIPVTLSMIVELRIYKSQILTSNPISNSHFEFVNDIAHHEVLRYHLHDNPVIRSRKPDCAT